MVLLSSSDDPSLLLEATPLFGPSFGCILPLPPFTPPPPGVTNAQTNVCTLPRRLFDSSLMYVLRGAPVFRLAA